RASLPATALSPTASCASPTAAVSSSANPASPRRRTALHDAARTLHPSSGDDDAVDAGLRRVRPVRLSPVAGGGPAPGRFSDDLRHRPVAWGRPRDDGFG